MPWSDIDIGILIDDNSPLYENVLSDVNEMMSRRI